MTEQLEFFTDINQPSEKIDISKIESDRIQAPDDFSEDEKEIWNRVVNSFHSTYFDKSQHDLMAQYVKHVNIFNIISRDMAEHIANKDNTDEKQYFEMLKGFVNMLNIQTKAVGLVATKLRITNNSLSNHDGNKLKSNASSAAPWEFDA